MSARSLSHVRFFATLWALTCQAPLSMGFSRQKYWRGLPCPPPGDLPASGIELATPVSPVLQEDSLPTNAIREAAVTMWIYKSHESSTLMDV